MCGVVNTICVYLTNVTFKRPDFKDEYCLLSKRTFMIFIVGPLITWAIWYTPLQAKSDLDLYYKISSFHKKDFKQVK